MALNLSSRSRNDLNDPVVVLYVEDNDADIIIFKRALKKAGFNLAELDVVKDGEEAIRYLENKRPDLIMLDLTIPKINGFDVLNYIKTHEELKRIPVIIITTSNAEEDKIKAYNLYANAYVKKPYRSFEFNDIVEIIRDFWLKVASLPR